MKNLITPGPWRPVFGNGLLSVSVQSADTFVCQLARSPAIRDGEAEANARLIAAAPELLAVCETLIARWESDNVPPAEKLSYCVAMLRAAVAKAKGSS